MVGRPSERQVWAVNRLGLRPDDRVLEIGCGRGTAVALVARLLSTGSITAIDRSAGAIAAARIRNQETIDAGRVELRVATLEDADFGGGRFDVVFAVNVSSFWLGDQRAVERVDRLLRPGGRLHLIWERPHARTTESIGHLVGARLAERGLIAAVSSARTRAGTTLIDVYATSG